MNDTSTPHPPFGNSPAPDAPSRQRWPAVSRLNVLRTMAALSTSFAIYMVVDAIGPVQRHIQRQRRMCDRVVATLLETQDLVELNRAAALAGLLECSISRRLPTPE